MACGPKGHAISIHALLAESDRRERRQNRFQPLFLSTLSLRRATAPWLARLASYVNFYPRSPCGERRCSCTPHSRRSRISIHALLAESDIGPIERSYVLCLFLSTLSLRRATTAANEAAKTANISIHALLAESDEGGRPDCARAVPISIHALLAESDHHFCGPAL